VTTQTLVSVLSQRLNPAQHEAVTAPDGPLLILAGAGSGKTRVISYRIAYLVQEREVPPEHIVAVTFTNKAAGEMKGRVEALIGQQARGVTLGTFHSICARWLRRDITRIGYELVVGFGFRVPIQSWLRASQAANSSVRSSRLAGTTTYSFMVWPCCSASVVWY